MPTLCNTLEKPLPSEAAGLCSVLSCLCSPCGKSFQTTSPSLWSLTGFRNPIPEDPPSPLISSGMPGFQIPRLTPELQMYIFGTAGSPQAAHDSVFEAFHLGFLNSYRNILVAHSALTAAKLSQNLTLVLHPEAQLLREVESQ